MGCGIVSQYKLTKYCDNYHELEVDHSRTFRHFAARTMYHWNLNSNWQNITKFREKSGRCSCIVDNRAETILTTVKLSVKPGRIKSYYMSSGHVDLVLSYEKHKMVLRHEDVLFRKSMQFFPEHFTDDHRVVFEESPLKIKFAYLINAVNTSDIYRDETATDFVFHGQSIYFKIRCKVKNEEFILLITASQGHSWIKDCRACHGEGVKSTGKLTRYTNKIIKFIKWNVWRTKTKWCLLLCGSRTESTIFPVPNDCLRVIIPFL